MRIKHQQGVASIAFVIMFPLFFGFFALAIEGTRYLTDSARLSDAVESASLAVAASVDHSSASEKSLVKNYIHAIEPTAHVKSSDITISTRSCQQIYGTECGNPGLYDKSGLNFDEYRVTVRSRFSSWFPKNTVMIGFDKNQTLVNSAVARKYQQDFVDIAFVTDFSGSMLDDFSGEQKAKYAGVIDILSNIMSVLGHYNSQANDQVSHGINGHSNHVAVVPYDNVNKEISGTTLSSYTYTYWWRWWSSARGIIGPSLQRILSPVFSKDELIQDGYNLHDQFKDGVPELGSAVPDKQVIQSYLGWTHHYHYNFDLYSGYSAYDTWGMDDWIPYWDSRWGPNWWDAHPTLRNRNYKIRNYIGCSNYNLYSGYSDWAREACSSYHRLDTGYFYNISLTNQFEMVKQQIDNFFPAGGTSSSQGIIPAAELLLNKTTTNKSNLIIVLSDGEDTDNRISKAYYDAGLCDYLRQKFINKGQTLKIAVIGFGYDTTKNPGLAECADSGSIFNATGYNAIYSQILDLITEEIGHLYYSDYKVTSN